MGKWLEAIKYYGIHVDSINNVLFALDSEDAVSVNTAKTVACDTNVKNDLTCVQLIFSCFMKMLKYIYIRHFLKALKL